MIDVFGTLGPSCREENTLFRMFAEGMTGIRINLSHVMLRDCMQDMENIKKAAGGNGILPKILIDMQGPEVRIGQMEAPMSLDEHDIFTLGEGGVPVEQAVLDSLCEGQEVLLDDGKIAATVLSADKNSASLEVKRGGLLCGRKSLAIVGRSIDMPSFTSDDIENIKIACRAGVTGVMQPFVRSMADLEALRAVLDENGGQDIKIYAKIENMAGVSNISEFFPYADEIVIARGDLGNAMLLWELPGVQKTIAAKCRKNNMPFMVVTQMLSSMEHSSIPTRAEVSDIFNAVLDGAASVMVTGETAVGEYPVETIRFLSNTAREAESYASCGM